MNSLLTIILSVSLVSCSSGRFVGTGEHSGSNGLNSQNSNSDSDLATIPVTPPPGAESGTTSNERPKTTPETQVDPKSPHALPPGTAVIPIAVGGASLTCKDDSELGVYCSSHIPSESFEPSIAWYATDTEKQWLPTTFVKTTDSVYAVKIPEKLRGTKAKLSIMLLDESMKYIQDLELQPAIDGNLIVDGSFEQYKISRDFPFVEPANPSSWVSYVPKNISFTTQCVPYLQFSSMLFYPDLPAADGEQWLKLASRCIMPLSPNAEYRNIGVKQTVRVTKGKTYILAYSYRGPVGARQPPSLRVLVDAMVANLTVSNTIWQEQVSTYLATGDKMEITFEQLNNDGDEGAHIDKVSLIEYPN